ncbi:TM2 domain-containing protein [Candidatus Poriferisodalis sp.]|uniref:TM2 domain-containing protein n=1 Tax=Candidatus Poriferisodalis sp. TaxID=3101277 RepID=UPI003B028F7F
MDIDEAQVISLKSNLSSEERLQFDAQYAARRKKPWVALLASLLLGMLGIDRFYIGHIGLGAAKLLTFGGAGLWAIVDWFLIVGATRRANTDVAIHVHARVVQLRPSDN